jgi:hypothetical protein
MQHNAHSVYAFLHAAQGTDNEPENGVFNCSHVHCRGYYHMSCIESTPGTQLRSQTTFLCPRHLCSTCEVGVSSSTKSKAAIAAAAAAGSSGKRLSKAKAKAIAETAAASNIVRAKNKGRSCTSGVYAALHRCMLCPVAYHSRCIPPTARHNEKAVLCPNHPEAQLPLLPGEESGGAAVSGAAAQWRSAKEIFVVPPKKGRGKGSSSMPTLVMPGSMPDAEDAKDHHFRLPLSVMEDYE